MIDPYRMVVVNIIGCLIIFGGVLFYKFIFPKKKINYLYLLILISILPCISILRPGAYESGDFNIHVRRSIEFYKILLEGNLLPSWATDFNAEYGYPLFTFNYVLPYYITSFFHLLGLSFINSFKLFLGLNLILSSVFMYLFSQRYFKNHIAAFGASICYLFTPYHLISTHFKATAGEILAFTLIPLFFLFLYNYLLSKKYINLIFTFLSFTFLIISHIYIAFFVLPIILLFIYIEERKVFPTIFIFIKILIPSLILSTFQWTAPIIYRGFLYVNSTPDDFRNLYYPTIKDLLYSPWRMGLLFQGPKGELSFLIGYTQLFTVFLSSIFIIKRKFLKKDKIWVYLWIFLLIITIFMITPYSKFVWQYLPNIRDASSHRLLILIAFYCSLLFGFIIKNLKSKLLIYLLIIITITSTILNWGQRRVIPTINDAVLKSNLSKGYEWGDTHFYANSKWVDKKNPWFTALPKKRIEAVSGQISYRQLERTSTQHIYNIYVKKDSKIKENTLYFPDWKVFANGRELKSFPDEKGIINFNIKKGKYILFLKYEQLPTYVLLEKINLVSLIIIILITLLSLLKPFYKKFHNLK